ncbi:MAG TPA: UDP-N-acetylmuramoyl-L-alanyl-D-glutamate--2,6-diaminopimelate ligase [Chloroflexi bacterium]|nr:UDP-N-acetylmuramoyl-L-alanyl-D-glutamate--2,6-diaminopimelate ligase [Chloroflexota bacterium]
MKPLFELVAQLPGLVTTSGIDVPIRGIALDSRKVKPGDIFVALEGLSLDGHKFVPKAIEAGAAAIVGSAEFENLSVPYVQVTDSRAALSYISAAFYDFPARQLTVIGVTGTDGKTTTSNLLYHILKAADLRVGMISTVNAVIGDQVMDTGFHVTTPDAPDVQRYLALMVEAGLTHVVLETTSHGLEQKRVDGCEFDIAVVTNITHEHLNDHGGSLERYRAAKARLFSSLAETLPKPQGNPRLSVLNRDDWSYGYLQEFTPAAQVCYGLTPDADIHAKDIHFNPSGIHFITVGSDFQVDVSSQLVGAFNVSNCLAALTAAIRGLGINPQIAANGITALSGIPGRMERIDLGQDFTAIVDFAHTPNALLNALQAARSMTTGRVIVVFGSAGLRDRQKRRMMSEVAAEWADLTVLTAEDPRTESLDQILAEMAAGAIVKGAREGESFWRVPDRGDALRLALKLARSGDIVMSCGKGHEQSMCFGETEYPWDDCTALRAALSEYLGIEGPLMPYLPTQER